MGGLSECLKVRSMNMRGLSERAYGMESAAFVLFLGES